MQTGATSLANSCQQLLALLDVTDCVHLHTLLHDVTYCLAQSLKPVKRLATCEWTQQVPTLLAQQRFANTDATSRNIDGPTMLGELLRPFTRNFRELGPCSWQV